MNHKTGRPITPAKDTGTSRKPGSRLLLLRGYVASALTPRLMALISSESRMQPFTINPCSKKCREALTQAQHNTHQVRQNLAIRLMSKASQTRCPHKGRILHNAKGRLRKCLAAHAPAILDPHGSQVIAKNGAAHGRSSVNDEDATPPFLL